jgi:hypothetical protein
MAEQRTKSGARGKRVREGEKGKGAKQAANGKAAAAKAKRPARGRAQNSNQKAKAPAKSGRSTAASNPAKGTSVKSKRVRPTAVVAIALAAGFLVWLAFIRGGGEDKAQTPSLKSSQGALVTADHLIDAVAGAGFPVYWVGPEPGNRYEVSRPASGQLRVRYLPAGESPGTKTPYLSVGSYTQPDAYATLEKLAAKPGSRSFEVAHGGLAYVSRNSESVYLAYPGVPTQIEVNDPHPGRAETLVRSGIVTPIG